MSIYASIVNGKVENILCAAPPVPAVVPGAPVFPLVGVLDPVTVGLGSPVKVGRDAVGNRVSEEEDPPPPPPAAGDPAAVESCANPTDGGVDRNTVYTFFYTKGCGSCELESRSGVAFYDLPRRCHQ